MNHKCRACQAGLTLRTEGARPATVRWSADDWRTSVETEARDTGMGMFVADLPTTALAPGATVRFTLRWADDGH